MSDSDAKLKCPTCSNTGKFSITAEITVHVTGDDYLEIHDEGGDREYGSESSCVCKACGHRARMGDFYDEE